MAEHSLNEKIRTSAEAMEDAILPAAHVAAACDGLHRTAETQPLPPAVTAEPGEEKSPAQWAYERLILYIKNFEEQLNDKEEVAVGFAGGDVGVMRIEGIGYFAPDLVTFYGRDEEGVRTQLIQHVAQLNVLLRAMPKPDPEQETRRIGFRLAADLGTPPARRRAPRAKKG